MNNQKLTCNKVNELSILGGSNMSEFFQKETNSTRWLVLKGQIIGLYELDNKI